MKFSIFSFFIFLLLTFAMTNAMSQTTIASTDGFTTNQSSESAESAETTESGSTTTSTETTQEGQQTIGE